MKKRRVLDSYALLAYLQGEPGGRKVRDLLEEAQTSGVPPLMCVVNLGEVYYILHRELGADGAAEYLEAIKLLPIDLVPADEEVSIQAAKIKAEHAISYADCFAAAVAVLHNTSLVTGDPEFREVEQLIDVEWL